MGEIASFQNVLASGEATQEDAVLVSQRQQYFMNEFFFAMLPCYIFIVTVGIRYARIQGKEEKFQAITYGLSLLLGIAGSPSLFWGAKFGWSNVFYLFGIIAWVLSYQLLKMEYIRDQSQSLYAHRLFWIFSFCFSVMRLFQDYIALFNVIIGVSRSTPNVILLMYAMYKPFDKEKEFQDYDEEIPSFARIFFEKFENNPIVAKLIGYSLSEDPQNDLLYPLSEDIEMQDNAYGFVETMLLENSRTQNTQSSFDMEKQLFNDLPRRNVVLSSNVERRIEEGKPKFYYGVIAQIGDSNYKVSKRFKDFEELYAQLSVIYCLENYPKLDRQFPQLEKIKHNDPDCEKKRVKAIEKWLSEVFHYPLFIHSTLLSFLEIKSVSATAPFLAYFNHVTRMKGTVLKNNKGPPQGSKILKPVSGYSSSTATNDLQNQVAHHFQQLQHQNKDQMEKRLLRYNSTAQKLVDIERIISSRKDDFLFEISCTSAEKQAYGQNLDYVFEIQFKPRSGGSMQRWTVSKAMTEIKDFNQELEEYLGFGVHQFNQYVTPILSIKDSNDKQHVKQKVAALNSYIKAIFSQKLYYSKPLFEFIEFDPEREIHLNSRMCTPRETLRIQDQQGNNKDSTGLGSNSLSLLQGLTDDREPVSNKIQANSGLKGVNLQKEFNLKDSGEKFSRSQALLENRDTSKERTIYGIDFNRLIISVQKIFTQEIPSLSFRNETNTVTKYLIFAEEFDAYGMVKVRLVLLKSYSQIKQLDIQLQRVQKGILDRSIAKYPLIPQEKQLSTKNLADGIKHEFEVYFEGILKLPRIEQIDAFQQFLNINDEFRTWPFSSTSGVRVYDFSTV